MVEKYCAVEMNSNFIPKLLNKNLNVIEGEFPLNIENSFDMILASHTISYRHKDFSRYIGAFFKCAWKLLNSGGILLLINSAGNEGEWTTFMNRIGMQEELIPSQKGYKEILLKLRLLGKLSILKIDSFIRTNNIDDMIDSLTFIASKGDPLRKTKFLSNRVKIEEVLKKSYFINNEFVFPLEHYFHILIKK